jgi:hypothetical protein
MGFGKMGKWNIGNIPLGNIVKIRTKRSIPLNTHSVLEGVLTFHYSIIPLFHVWGKITNSQSIQIISIRCRVPETSS